MLAILYLFQLQVLSLITTTNSMYGVQKEKIPCEVIEILDEETSHSHVELAEVVRAAPVDAPLSGAESSSSSASASSDAESSDNYEGEDEVVAKKPARSKKESNSLVRPVSYPAPVCMC